jgi:hypothetical protein
MLPPKFSEESQVPLGRDIPSLAREATQPLYLVHMHIDHLTFGVLFDYYLTLGFRIESLLSWIVESLWLPHLLLTPPWCSLISWGWILFLYIMVCRIMALSQCLGSLIIFLMVCKTCLRTCHPLRILVLDLGEWWLRCPHLHLIGVMSLNQISLWEVRISPLTNPILATFV